jgi:cysteine/glycine-rich protein
VPSKAPPPPSTLPSPTAPPKAAAKASPFGGGNRCAVCEKAVYAADPQFTTDGRSFHKTCFKCLVCKGQLGLSALAQIEGFVLCKTCYKAEFKLRGKYR